MKRKKNFSRILQCAQKAGVAGGRKQLEGLGFKLENLEAARQYGIRFGKRRLGYGSKKAVACAEETITTAIRYTLDR